MNCDAELRTDEVGIELSFGVWLRVLLNLNPAV
jgi:hypothetical protein